MMCVILLNERLWEASELRASFWCDVSKYLEVPMVPTLLTRNNVIEWSTKLVRKGGTGERQWTGVSVVLIGGYDYFSSINKSN